MAKISKSISLKNATITLGDMSITEVTKDDTRVYDLEKLLKEWDGIEGVSLTIKQDDEIPADE